MVRSGMQRYCPCCDSIKYDLCVRLCGCIYTKDSVFVL